MTKRYISRAALIIAALGAASSSTAPVRAALAPDIARYSAPAPFGSLERAREMMQAGNWLGAIDALRALLRDKPALNDADREECDRLLALAMYEAGEPGCIEMLTAFAATYPASAATPEILRLRGDYYFFAHEFGQAAKMYAEADIDGLDSRTRSLYLFRLGVSQTKSGAFADARSTFRALRNFEAYADRADFYIAYLDYLNQNYRDAYNGFSRLEKKNFNLPGFQPEYYMAQIEYCSADYSRAAARALRLLNSSPEPELTPEMNRIAGESLFKTGHPEEARPFLIRYWDSCDQDPDKAIPTAIYSLGCILYSEGDTEAAARLMSFLADRPGELGQSANLYLGQCAVRDGDINSAAIKFERAYSMGINPAVSEAALYNYVAARTRGGNVPFSSSIPMLEDFLSSFPNSKFSPQVEEYLAAAYFNEKDYKQAMRSISRIKNPSAKVLAAKQKVAYELGAEYAANNAPDQAETYMKLAASMTDRDKAIARQALLWLADAEYAQGKFPQATNDYRAFIAAEKNSTNRTLAIYGLAYSLYRQGRYAQAASQFQEAMNASPKLDKTLYTDAVIRLADCLYYSGDSQSAIQSYSRAIDQGATDADYALLRRAMTHGSAGNQNAKIADLQLLLRNWPNSKWLPQALLEEGLAFTDLGDTKKAMSVFEQLSDQFPMSPEARKGTLNLAIAQVQAGDYQAADRAYKVVISRWPSSEEAQMASSDLRKIYAAQGNLHQLAAWLKTVPGAPQLDTNQIEQLAFDAAERALNDRADDTAQLEKYIRDYPDGKYLAQALYDLTDVYATAGRYADAITMADRLARTRPDASQTPAALLVKAEILESHFPDRKKEALSTWREVLSRGGADYSIDAFAGIMRTSSDPSERLDYARRLGRTGGLSTDLADQAALHEALALIDLRHPQEGRAILARLAQNPSTEAGARAAVELGLNYLNTGQTDQAEKILADFTDVGSPHAYWLARGFIALADVYKEKGKTSLAREYLSSLKANYPGSENDIREMIDSRLKSWKK